MIRAKPDVEALSPYAAPLEGRRSLLRLDFNESTVGPSPNVVEAIRNLPPDAYATYPEYAGLNEAFAATLGVTVKHVEAFNGVDAAIRAIFDAYGEQGGTFLTTVPAIVALARSAPETLVVVDELYVAFTGQSVVPAALELPNVVALQSLSKAAGIAALRLGFAIGHPSLLERLRRVTGPYDINTFAVVAGKAALADPDHTRRYIAEVLSARTWTLGELERLGVRC